MHGTVATVTLNFDRLQTSCLGEGREGVGDRLELWRERAVVAKITETGLPLLPIA